MILPGVVRAVSLVAVVSKPVAYRSFGDSVDSTISSGSTKWLIVDSLNRNFSFSSSSFIIFSLFLFPKNFFFISVKSSIRVLRKLFFFGLSIQTKENKMTHHEFMTNRPNNDSLKVKNLFYFEIRIIACVQVGMHGPCCQR